MTLVGFGFFGDPFKSSAGWTEENEIGRLWKRFSVFRDQQRIKNVLNDRVTYEVHIEHAETKQTGEYEVFVGVEVDSLEAVLVEMTVKLLPAVTYAVFTLQGPEINSDWSRRIAEWMAQSGYRRPYPYGFQRYDERFKGLEQIADSILDVCIPVERAP